MNPIDARFQTLHDQGRKAFIPFLTAGDPSLDATIALARTLIQAGADLLEIGFPYSDPIADGPVIQASYTRALDRGVRLDDIFAALRILAATPEVQQGIPLVAMISFSLIHRRGVERFLNDARQAGLSGAIVPDLPVDESERLAVAAAARDFSLIQLVTPTTPRDRAVRIAQSSTGFLYCVSVTGITGERDRLPEQLGEQLRWLRGQTWLPLCVGFGISKPEHVTVLRDLADGVIVGSALMRRIEQAGSKPLEAILDDVRRLTCGLVAALNPETGTR
jgi:tryptophan synthase alpha chain